MTVTVDPPPAERPDAGVIEEARARQRRHRGVAAAVLAAAAIAILLGFAGGGGSRTRSAPIPARHRPARTAGRSSASCLSAKGKALGRAPSQSLLSILGVLR